MATLSNIVTQYETRLCVVDGTVGYFHCWEQWMDPSSLGVIKASAHVNGIVEFKDGVRRVDCESIKFVDEQNKILQAMPDPFET